MVNEPLPNAEGGEADPALTQMLAGALGEAGMDVDDDDAGAHLVLPFLQGPHTKMKMQSPHSKMTSSQSRSPKYILKCQIRLGDFVYTLFCVSRVRCSIDFAVSHGSFATKFPSVG